MFHLARDKDGDLYLFIGEAPVKANDSDTFTTSDINTDVIFIDEVEKQYPEVTFENSPVQYDLVKL